MRHVARKILISLLVILPFSLCWVTTMAVPAYRIHPDNPPDIGSPVESETSGTEATALVLLGAGILSLAIRGRNQCRRTPAVSMKSL
ncbi:MAG: hypothetical protein H6Q80_1907 [Deltaproteobacteria bacterium]|nr:hypothetical protein [Deltaproteobacteria bacterium]